MELYHGSYTKVEQPQIIKGQYTKDFGTGFYCTILKEQAERWAGKYDSPWVNVYEYTKNENLRILEFNELTDDWLDFVVACRAGQRHDYDIVIWVLAKFKYPTHQIAFCTEAALATLTFKSVYSL